MLHVAVDDPSCRWEPPEGLPEATAVPVLVGGRAFVPAGPAGLAHLRGAWQRRQDHLRDALLYEARAARPGLTDEQRAWLAAERARLDADARLFPGLSVESCVAAWLAVAALEHAAAAGV